jgi:hypothetical protein
MRMKTTKILIALAATATLSLALIGVAYGYYVNNQTSTNTNTAYTANPDFWGWFRGCLGFGPNQPPIYQNQPPSNSTTQSPSTYGTPQAPYQQQNPNQGNYPYGYEHGCWGW